MDKGPPSIVQVSHPDDIERSIRRRGSAHHSRSLLSGAQDELPSQLLRHINQHLEGKLDHPYFKPAAIQAKLFLYRTLRENRLPRPSLSLPLEKTVQNQPDYHY